MKNPLIKRLPRELVGDIGKYIVIFLFMVITIGFVSGFVVATHSLATAYDSSFVTQNVEDGHFIIDLPSTADSPETPDSTYAEAYASLLGNVESADSAEFATMIDSGFDFEEFNGNTFVFGDVTTEDLQDSVETLDVALYEIFYKDADVDGTTYRVYKNREDVNIQYVMDGRLAENDNEITIDRLFAENHSIEIGDKVKLGNYEFEIVGTVALPDYTALFESNTNLMFNAQTFTVALVTEEGFEKIPDNQLNYSYAWTFNDESLNSIQKNDKSNDLKDELVKTAMLTDFVTEPNSQAIHFAGDDIGSDESMFITFLYIVIVIMAFVFAVTTSNTIEKESKVIGTLRASGYTKGELTFHYIILPVIVTLVGALIGNILGYTIFKNVVADMYYHSYSLPPYETLWSAYAFVNTTVVPCVLMLVINFFVIVNKLSLSPLKFLRNDLKKSKNKKAKKLPNIGFMGRFRLRILMQNFPTYIIMFIGILFANFLLLFGLMMNPLLDDYKNEVAEKTISDYQYIMKIPASTESETAEKFAVTSLETTFENRSLVDEISVYGFENRSLYASAMNFDENRIYASEGILEKYGLKIGDTITLQKKFSTDTYDFTIEDTYDYPASLALFMNIDDFRETFGKDEDYYTGYLSDKEITDIDEDYIATTITNDDLTVLADQLTDSMGEIFPMFTAFSVILYILLIYLLSKIIIEKNTNAVSVVKILGYQNGEITGLYMIATGIVVVLSILISLPLCNYGMQGIFSFIMSSYPGWISLNLNPNIWVKISALGIGSYAVVGLFQFRKIKKIPMDEALKNAE